MDHPLVILGVSLVVILAAVLLGVWVASRMRRRAHLAEMLERGRVLSWDEAIARLGNDDDPVVVFDSLAQRIWLIEGGAKSHFVDGHEKGVRTIDLAKLLEEHGDLIHPLPCVTRDAPVHRRLRDAGLGDRYVFLNNDFGRGIIT